VKALTLTQPWATLVAIGAKRIETRSWRTAYRGPLAIHAAKGFPKWAREFTTAPACYEAVMVHSTDVGSPAYPLGVVLATCRLIACIPTRDLQTNRLIEVDPVAHAEDFHMTDQERAFGDYAPGRFAWLLTDIKPLPVPIHTTGALGLWEWVYA